MPLQTNQIIYQGETKILIVTLVNGDGGPVSITDATIKYQFDDVTKTTGGSGITITDGPGGQFQIALGSADTIDCEEGIYPHECKVKLPADDSVYVVFVGSLRIYPTLIATI